MLPAFRATCMRSAANSARFCTAKKLDVEELRLRVTRKYLPLADSTSKLDESARCSRASIAESLKTIEDRQEQRKKSGIFAIEGTRCKHGFPRAYMVYKCWNCLLHIHNPNLQPNFRSATAYS